jgi:hypothetical protein
MSCLLGNSYRCLVRVCQRRNWLVHSQLCIFDRRSDTVTWTIVYARSVTGFLPSTVVRSDPLTAALADVVSICRSQGEVARLASASFGTPLGLLKRLFLAV